MHTFIPAPAALKLSILALAIHSTLALADPAASSAYHADLQNSHVEDATSRGVQQVNFITCLLAAMRPDAMVNEGDYAALVDGSKCENDATATSAGTTTYNTAYINATRATNNDPMISRIWLDETDEGRESTIFVRVSATEPPSASNAYGKFRMDYCGSGEDAVTCAMNGYLEGSEVGMRYFENERTDDGTPSIKAVQLNASGTTSGTGRMSVDSSHETSAFDFAYNASLFRRKDLNGDDQCFSRDASDPDTGMSVWRYGLYDASTGARVNRASGFQIEFMDGGTTHRGYLGYGGLSLPSEAMNALTNGATVQKVDYSTGGAPTRTDYTVLMAPGKLTKHTKHTRTLHEIDKVKFSVFVGNNGTALFAGAHANTTYEIYWDEAANVFKASGEMSCDQNGCNQSALSPEKSVSVSFWAAQSGVQGFSNTLGGEVFVALGGATSIASSDAVNVVYRVQDLVYPTQMPSTLYCLRDCPTAASMNDYFSQQQHEPQDRPFVPNPAMNFGPATAGTQITYHSDTVNALLKDAANASVVFTDGEALENSQYRNGIRSGKLFTDLVATECSTGSGTYCEDKVNQQEVYYVWETGADSYNQFAAVKDSSGAFLQFDAPLQVNFSVPDEAKYGDYRGQNVMLQYSGFGELWGIPGYCVAASTNAPVSCEGSGEDKRYVPAFTIPFNTTQGRVTLGDTTYLVKWLDREIRFANKPASVCDTAGLALPSGIVLPTAAELQNPSDPSSAVYIGAKPVVTAAPRVIHGEVKY